MSQSGRNPLPDSDTHDPARSELTGCRKNVAYRGFEVDDTIGAGSFDYDTERQYLSVLLKFKIAVERYKYFSDASSNIHICRNSFVSRVEYRCREFALYRWKLVKKLIDAFATFKVIEQRSDRNAGTNKHKITAEDVRVSVGDIGKRDPRAFPFRCSVILP
jgi:hypothetical protein